MATCVRQTGMLFWKKPCAMDAIGPCRRCSHLVCMGHGTMYRDGSVLCAQCAGQPEEDSTGTVFMAAPLIAGAVASQAAERNEPAGSNTWHGPDAGASSDAGFDGGSSDSGGDSGSSSD